MPLFNDGRKFTLFSQKQNSSERKRVSLCVPMPNESFSVLIKQSLVPALVLFFGIKNSYEDSRL